MTDTSATAAATNTNSTDHESFDDRVRQETIASVERLASEGQEAIERRLGELEVEWDMEKTLQTVSASLAMGGSILAATVNRRWIALPGIVGAFLLQHAVQGWSPLHPLLRSLGYRTQAEIDRERLALKAKRGDFAYVSPSTGRSSAMTHAPVPDIIRAVDPKT